MRDVVAELGVPTGRSLAEEFRGRPQPGDVVEASSFLAHRCNVRCTHAEPRR
jgi:hypothetical protein